MRLVVDERLAARGLPGVVLIRRRRGAIRAEDALAAVADAPGHLVLARAPAADPGASAVLLAAELTGAELARLPAALDRARWTVLVAARWCVAGLDALPRRVQCLVGIADSPIVPRRVGADGESVPAIRPAVLARWAHAGWRPCGRCRGGGLRGAPCARCGAAAC